MRHVKKKGDSIIISKSLTYIENGDNRKLRDELLIEQNQLCAYTETYLGRTDQKDIDHFNPLLKSTDADSYHNWFLCKAIWNREKGSKWDKYQPVLHPTDELLESKIFYYDGNYILEDLNDLPSKNLVKLLKLDDADLAADRKKYIERLRQDAQRCGEAVENHVKSLLQTNPERVYFIRAIEEEFGFKVFE